jgi:DNA-binding transcriptional LysR family regulator
MEIAAATGPTLTPAVSIGRYAAMNLANFDLNLLLVFHAIYSEKSLTRAGRRLGLSQPAISHALNRLRQVLNNPLFIRKGRQMEPTPLSRQINPSVRTIIALAQKAVTGGDEFNPCESDRTFHIGMQDYPMMVVLPKLLERLEKDGSRIGIRVYDLNMEERRTALEEGRLELVIGCKQEYDSHIYQQHLFNDRVVCIMRRDHPDIGNDLDLDTFVKAEFIRLTVSNQAAEMVDTLLEEIGRQRSVRVTVEQEVAIFPLVCNSNLLANVAELAAMAYARFLPIKIMPIPLDAIELQHFQYWHDRNHHDPGHRWLRQQVTAIGKALN